MKKPVPSSLLSEQDLVSCRLALQKWGSQNYRPFPWRQQSDPYALLIAEVMLHRTQVRQVVPIYERFMMTFPNVQLLSIADKREILKLLASLGLNWRAELVKDLADTLMYRYQGAIPQDRAELLTLPGVSDYIASAVRCFTWNYPDPLLDTNTVRIAGRLFNLEVRDSSRRSPFFRQSVTNLMDLDDPRSSMYSLLDLAAKVCVKKLPPVCFVCPLVEWCHFGRQYTSDNKNKTVKQS